MMACLDVTPEVSDASPLVCNSPHAAVGMCLFVCDGEEGVLFSRRPEIVLRQGGNVRGADSLDILADSRVQSVFVSYCTSSSSPPLLP